MKNGVLNMCYSTNYTSIYLKLREIFWEKITSFSLETLLLKYMKNICQGVFFLGKLKAYILQLFLMNESFACVWPDSFIEFSGQLF